MRGTFKFLIALCIVGGAHLWAQTPDDTAAPQQVGPTPQYTHVDQPAALNFLGEAAGNSNLSLGISAGYLFTNYNYTTQGSNNDLNQITIGPRISLNSIHRRFSLNFAYIGQMTIDPAQSNYNYFGQNGSIDILYQLSAHWQVHAGDHYLYTSDPFSSYFTSTGPPLPNQPNPTFYYPTAQSQQNTATLDLSDRLTRADTVTLNGYTNFRRYNNYSNVTVNLYNVQTYSGGANFTHQFSPRLKLGGGYSFTSLDFSHGFQRSGINQMTVIVDYQFSPSISISGFIGPEYVSSKNTVCCNFLGQPVIIPFSAWTPAGGVNFGWKNAKNSVTGGYSRQTSDGGGFLATTYVNLLQAAYMRQLSSKWNGTISTQYGHNQSVYTSGLQLGPNRTYSNWNTQIQATRRLSNSMMVSFRYAYIRQSFTNIYAIGTTKYSYNAFGINFDYDWNHPLGR